MIPARTDPRGATRVGSLPRHHASDIEQWGVATLNQLGHYARTNRFFGLLGFVVIVSALTIAFEVDVGTTAVQVQQLYSASEYLSSYLGYTVLWVILSAAFFGGDALSVDFSTGAGYYTLVLPIRRPVQLAGRYAAATLVTLAVVGMSYAFGAAGAAYFFGFRNVPWILLLESFGLAALFTLAALGVAFCVSSFIRSPATSVLVTVMAVYGGLTTLQAVVELAGFEPWFSLTYAGGAMTAILSIDFVHQLIVPVGQQQYYTTWSATVTEGIEIMAGYIAVFLPLSAYFYQRKESTG